MRPAVQVEGIKAPIMKSAAISGSGEPPPTLAAADNSATQDVLNSGGLSGAVRVEAPAPPVAFASPEQKTGGELEMPKVISSRQPIYPDIARTQKIDGAVAMVALIDATGTVSDIKVTSGPLLLRQAAMDALRKWKYQPARLNGQPTSVRINVSINFAPR